MDADVIRSRLEDRISRAIDEACAAEMVWGVSDCVLWAANVLHDVVGGDDPASRYRGQYFSQRRAHELLRSLGGLARAVDVAARQRGWHRIAPTQATIGDLGMAMTGMGPACLLKWRGDFWVGPSDYGVALLPSRNKSRQKIDCVRVAWAVC